MIPKFTLRALLVAVAAIAVGMAALLHSSPRVANIVVNGVFLAVLGAACLAVGSRPPARSFLLGFAIACSGFLVVDVLSRRGFIWRDNFTRTLVAMVDDALPPIVQRGPPGTTRYFRNDGRFPVYFYKFGDDGSPAHGQMTLEEARRQGAFRTTPYKDLPQIDNIPTSYTRSEMLPYVLSAAAGLLGGLLAYLASRRTMAARCRPD